jgi:hypothetical protein
MLGFFAQIKGDSKQVDYGGGGEGGGGVGAQIKNKKVDR